MATILIHAGAANGFISASLAGRKFSSAVVADYTTAPNNLAANALAFADQVVASCAAITLADADSVYMQGLVEACASGILSGSELGVGALTAAQTAANLVLAKAVAAAAKACAAVP